MTAKRKIRIPSCKSDPKATNGHTGWFLFYWSYIFWSLAQGRPVGVSISNCSLTCSRVGVGVGGQKELTTSWYMCVRTWQESCQTFEPKAAELPSHACSLFRRKSLQPRTQESCARKGVDFKQEDLLVLHPNHQSPFVECLCACPSPAHSRVSLSAQQQALSTQLIPNGITALAAGLFGTAPPHQTQPLSYSAWRRLRFKSSPPYPPLRAWSDPCSAFKLQRCPQGCTRNTRHPHPNRGRSWWQATAGSDQEAAGPASLESALCGAPWTSRCWESTTFPLLHKNTHTRTIGSRCMCWPRYPWDSNSS